MNKSKEEEGSIIFMPKLDEPIRVQQVFIISYSLTIEICVLRAFFLVASGLYFFPFDPHIFADPDPGSQNVADSRD